MRLVATPRAERVNKFVKAATSGLPLKIARPDSRGRTRSVRATGANWVQVVRYGVIPQIVPSFTALTIYRWDINIRSSTIVGFVGGGGIGDGDGLHAVDGPLHQPGEHLAGGALHDAGDPAGMQVAQGLHPAHRPEELLDQRLADAVGVVESGHVRVLHHRHFRGADVHSREPLAQALGRGLHQRAVRRRAHGEHLGDLRAVGLGRGHPALHRRAVAGDSVEPV